MATKTPLRGRDEELRVLDGLLEAVRAGESRALVVRGEPGVGKTALLEYAVGEWSESGFRVARAVGVESEMELAYAALHQLCAPVLDRVERLPGPQRDALGVAFGLSAGDAPDRFLLGLAVLSLVSEVAEERPLLCLVDDAQWLDRASAQALAFVARRLLAESVALVFAVREPSEELDGLPELVVKGLRDGDARALLDSAVRGPLDERVRERIVAETRGNPLALLELPRALTHAELAGGFGLPDARELSGRIEDSFRRRLEPLPVETRRLLLVAAAEPVGEPVLVWRAAERLGIGFEAAAPAAGLVEFGAQVRFRHPLVRSAVYRAASLEDRRAVHRALAEATDREVDPDRRAWHRAHAALGPDEDVAGELERSAGRARGRGGVAAAAAFLERATELTPEPARRGARALAAAQAKHEAGASDAAAGLLGTAQAGPLDELQRARVDLLRAQIASVSSRGSDAPPLLLRSAKRLEPLDPALARETYLEAFSAVLFAGRFASGSGALGVAQAARRAPRPSHPPAAVDLLLDGQALLITEGFAAGAPVLKRALSAFRSEVSPSEEQIRWLLTAGRVALGLWDDESCYVLSARQVELARAAGALTALALALGLHAAIRVYAGDVAAAEALGEEAHSVSASIGTPDVSASGMFVAAWRGREAEASALIEARARDAAARGEGRAIGASEYASALLYNGIGRFEDALAAAERAAEHPEELYSTLVLPELLEAAIRSGKAERAARALGRLVEATRASGTDWALGIQARSRALLGEGEAAEGLYREAIDRLGRTRVRTDRARAHHLYGEWLRRQGRRRDAREQLRTAQEMFASMSAEAFAIRAERELLATGETVCKRTVETRDELTAQEAGIARMARDGASNREIATQLFLSHKTVQYHLHKVYAKLGISNRNELNRVLPGD
jgi:DNA-binding CsgD family transcriptional regulator